MTELLFTLVGAFLGSLVGWHCHAVREKRRKIKDLEAWHKTRKFFSPGNTKDW